MLRSEIPQEPDKLGGHQKLLPESMDGGWLTARAEGPSTGGGEVIHCTCGSGHLRADSECTSDRSSSRRNLDLDRLGDSSGLQRPRVECEDVALAWELEEAHAKRFRFGQSPSIVPVIVINAVGSDNGASAVGSALAVHEHRTGG